MAFKEMTKMIWQKVKLVLAYKKDKGRRYSIPFLGMDEFIQSLSYIILMH